MTNRIVRCGDLQNGMTVLFAYPGYEGHLDRFINDHSDLLSAGALGHCYWRKISQITYNHDRSTISFGTYDNNGILLNRKMPVEYRCIIKVDVKREKVLEAVKNALLQQDSATYHGKSSDAPRPEDVVDQIYKILGLD